MLIKSELSGCKIELIECFGEHQSQLFYNRLRIHNPCWNNYGKSQFDVKLGCTIPLDLSHDNKIPILCTPIHFFQRLHDKQQGQQQNRNSTSGYTIHQSKHHGNDSNHLKSTSNHTNSNVAVHCNNKKTIGLTSKSMNEMSNSLVNANNTNEGVSNDNFTINDALATIRVYFPVKLMQSANELKISSDLKKRFHLSPHLHEFVAYPELLTLSVDQLSTCILKGLSMVHLLIQYTLSVPKELYTTEKDQVTLHEPVDNTNNKDDNMNDIDNTISNVNENNESLLSQENRFILVNRGIYNRLNALIKIQNTEKMIIMPKRIQWSLGLIHNRKHFTFNQKFLDCNNFINSSLSQSICSFDKDLSVYSNENISNHSNQNNIDYDDKINHGCNNYYCNGYLRDWVGLSMNDHVSNCNSNHQHHDHLSCSTKNQGLNNTSSSLSPSSSTSLSTMSSFINDNHDHSNIRIAFVRRESSECGNAIASCFLQNKYSPAKLRRSRLRGTDSLVIKFKRNNLSRDYYPSESVPNSIVQYNEQSNCDKFFSQNTTFSTTGTTTTTNTSNSNSSTEKRMRCDQNKILCILTSPLNYSSNYYSRNTHYDNHHLPLPPPLSHQHHNHHQHHSRLLSPTTLTTSSIASRVKWGANLTLLSNSFTNCHDVNDDNKTNYPINPQYSSEMNTKELNQFTNGLNAHTKSLSPLLSSSSSLSTSTSTLMLKTCHHDLDRIILQPRPRIPPKRLDLANQDLELALKRSLSDCSMQSSNKNYYNSSIKKSLAYSVRLNNQHTGNRDSTNKNLVRRTKTVLRTKRKRHKTFTNSRRQKSKAENIKSQKPKLHENSPITNLPENNLTSAHSNNDSDNLVMNESNETSDRLINEQLSRLPLPKLTLAKNSVGEFNVVENREENIGKLSEICDHKPTIDNRIVTSVTNSNIDNSIINNCQTITSPSTSSSISSVSPSVSTVSSKVTSKSSKRKSDNKQRVNCLTNDRISQIKSEISQNSNGACNIDQLNHGVRKDIGLVNHREQMIMPTSTVGSLKTDEQYSTFTTNYEYKPVMNCIVPNKPTGNSANSSSLSSQQVQVQCENSKSTSLTNTSTAIEFAQSIVHNISGNPSFHTTTTPTTTNIFCGHSTNSPSQHPNISYLSPIQPVTMWSRLSNPLPAPDPPTELFNTKRVPSQYPPHLSSNMNHKVQQYPMIGSVNSMCSNQGIPHTLITNRPPYHAASNTTTIPINSTVHLPNDAYLKQNTNTNVAGLTTNPVQYSPFCNPNSLNDLNSKQLLQHLNKMQLNSQLYSNLPTAMHLSLPSAPLPNTQFSQISSSSSSSCSSSSSPSVFSSANPIRHWPCTNNQFLNFPSNSNITKLPGNIPVGYETTSLVIPSGNSIVNNSNISNHSHNGFLSSYPFLLSNPTFANMNLCNSTPLLGACPSSLQSMLGASYLLGAQNYNNHNNNHNHNNHSTLQNCHWLP
ncbi:unnamed protein product [Schistosoma turkestanicum]|nr:unnamed protein product [Schistosoma turkestanicum]